MNFQESRLAKLNAIAVQEYERTLAMNLSDPERLKAVYGSEFWRAENKSRLQNLVNTAQMMLSTDGSAIILVTDKDQHAVVATNNVECHNDTLDASYCKYTVNEKHPFGVVSADTHALVCTSRATTQKGIRAYLGVPLIMDNGCVIGSFCVWMNTERVWDENDVLVLTNLAALSALVCR